VTRASLLLLVSLAVVGCKKPAKPGSSDDLEVRATTPSAPTAAPVPREALDELLASFRRVHFATDSAVIDREDLEILKTSAKVLLDHPSIVVDIEGHADERGTFDYNLALGTARAEAVRKALGGLGVPLARLRTTTYGEEHPVADGHDEVAWAQNRRAEFRVRVADGVQ
jgi:peptidoglycan-associated lipoprotein